MIAEMILMAKMWEEMLKIQREKQEWEFAELLKGQENGQPVQERLL